MKTRSAATPAAWSAETKPLQSISVLGCEDGFQSILTLCGLPLWGPRLLFAQRRKAGSPSAVDLYRSRTHDLSLLCFRRPSDLGNGSCAPGYRLSHAVEGKPWTNSASSVKA